jgi:hypothetical protein
VQLIYDEPHGIDPRVILITRGGTVEREDKVTQEKTTKDLGVRKVAKNTQTFDATTERRTFEYVRKEFRRDQGSSSRTWPKVREYGMPPVFDQSASPREGKEVNKLMEFLYTCIKIIQDENTIREL